MEVAAALSLPQRNEATAENSSCAAKAKDMLDRLQEQYLPELRELYHECSRVLSKLGLDGTKKDLQDSECRLVQFVSVVESAINRIEQYDPSQAAAVYDFNVLSALESKITKSILPVKPRLLSRLQENVIDSKMKQQQLNVSRSTQPSPANVVTTTTTVSSSSLPTAVAAVGNAGCSDKRGSKVNSSFPASAVSRLALSAHHNDGSGHVAKAPPAAMESPRGVMHATASMLSISSLSTTSNSTSVESLDRAVLTSYATPRGQQPVQQQQPAGYSNGLSDATTDASTDDENSVCKDGYIVPGDAFKATSKSATMPVKLNTIPGSLYGSVGALKRKLEPQNGGGIDIRQQLHQVPHVDYLRFKMEASATASAPGMAAGCMPCLDLNAMHAAQGQSQEEEEEFLSSRRRRRLNQIVPNPRKPRTADYSCSVCNEGYHMTVVENPWWAVFKHECPRCRCLQIPRIDIGVPSNAIELDPNVIALYGEGVGGSDDEEDGDDDEGSDCEDDDDAGVAAQFHSSSPGGGVGREEQCDDPFSSGDVEKEELRKEVHPFDGEGLLAAEEASKLLVLMCHARTCAGVHASPKHAEICKSTKFLMLHIRDCSGTDVHGRDCQFPWCLPCKKMLRHLTHCYDPSSCVVCNPWTLPESFQQLRNLNSMRSQIFGSQISNNSASAARK